MCLIGFEDAACGSHSKFESVMSKTHGESHPDAHVCGMIPRFKRVDSVSPILNDQHRITTLGEDPDPLLRICLADHS